MFSGISFNYSICGIIIYGNKKDNVHDQENEQKEHLALKDMILEWKKKDLLPIQKMFNIEVAYNMQELKAATEKFLEESLGVQY